ncbi:TPA: hypothetical protein DCX16_03145 [bacterium]|nr:hypothetical protein [bacterium]
MFKLKLLLLKNRIITIPKDHSLLKIVFVSLLSFVLLFLTFFFVYKACRFVSIFPFGDLLIERGLFLFFFVIFSLLVFSSLITSLSTMFMSKEVSLLMSLPISQSSIFNMKFLESLILSSWAPVLLSIPFLFGYGVGKSFIIWPFILISLPLLAIISCSIGSCLLVFFSLFFPMKKGNLFIIGLLVLVFPLFLFCLKFGIFKEIPDQPFVFFGKLIDSMGFSTHPLLPSYWFVSLIKFIKDGNVFDGVFYLMVIASNAVFFLVILQDLGSRFYLSGIDRIESSGSHSKHRNIFVFTKLPLFFLPKKFKALCSKDITVFLRDPVQIAQFLIFFGIIFIYTLNLPRSPYKIDIEYWKNLVLFLNICAIGLITSTLTTRFVFPLLSLEGGRFWIILISPVTKTTLIFQKLFLSSSVFFLISVGLISFLNTILATEKIGYFLSCSMIGIMTIGLCSLSVGLGALFPDFKNPNPARIVSGFGGTINAIASCFYVITSVLLIAVPVQFYALNRFSYNEFINKLWFVIGMFLSFSFLVFFVPLFFGVKGLEKKEV